MNNGLRVEGVCPLNILNIKKGILALLFSILFLACQDPANTIKYTVSFDTGGAGASAVASQTINSGGKATQPDPAPTKISFNFAGWYKDKALTQRFDFASELITANIILYAKWERPSLSFDTEGGSFIDPQRVDSSGKATQPANPTRTGYIFENWYKDKTYKQVFDFSSEVISTNITIYAKWSIATNTLSFDTGGAGASLVDPQAVDPGALASKPATPTRTGYIFDNWYKDEAYKQVFDFSSEIISSSLTIYAKWTIITNLLSFDTGGGSRIDPQTVDSGALASKPATPTRTGYIFDNWYKDEAYKQVFDFSSEIISSSLTIYAKWTIITNLLSFYTGGGSRIDPQTVDSGALASKPATPTRTGYIFDNWYKDKAYKQVFDFSSEIISSSLTIYAKWTIITNLLSFDTGGGSHIDPQTVDSGALASKPATPTRTGYIFDNWYKDEAYKQVFDFSSEIISASITIYAKWTIITNLLSFDTGGGSRIDPQTVDSGSLASKPATPTRTGYIFDNWYKDEAYKQVFDFSSEIISSSLTIYAKWTIITNLLSFYTGGGSRIDPQTVDSGALASKPATPTRTGYIFDNWYKDEAYKQVFDFSSEIISASITIYAKWTIITNLLSFDTGGGSRIDPQTVDSGALASKPATPTRTGYIFDNWYKDEAYKQVFDFSSEIISSSLIIYAKWSFATNTLSFDTGGGSRIDPQTVDSGALASKPATPTRRSYSFDNWYKDKAYAEVFDFSSEVISASITIYAKWYKPVLSFDTVRGSLIYPQTVDSGTLATKPAAPSRTGYIFDNWYKDKAYSQVFDFSSEVMRTSITIYAKWSFATNTLSFDLRGGSGDFKPITVATGSPATNPTPWPYRGNTVVPQKTAGSNELFFGGWYTESNPAKQNGRNKFDFTQDINADLTLYARWYTEQPRNKAALQTLLSNANAGTNLNLIDVRKVTNMRGLIYDLANAKTFNYDIGGWDTSAVTNMKHIFAHAYEFNQDIGNWDTSAVTDMSQVFIFASEFNQNIGNWDTSAVADMEGMFQSATAFNQDIGAWKVGAVIVMDSMFKNAAEFNQDLTRWAAKRGRIYENMFSGASSMAETNKPSWSRVDS